VLSGHIVASVPTVIPNEMVARDAGVPTSVQCNFFPCCSFSREGLGRPIVRRTPPLDAHVGARVRQHPLLLGINQKELAAAAKVSVLQVHRSETGCNRISASRLFAFATALDVPVSYFFDAIPVRLRISGRLVGADRRQNNNLVGESEAIELANSYYKIRDARVRKSVFRMVKALGTACHSETPRRHRKSLN
jgi:transcriptional regulator with XRE-family HTH domain